VSRFVPRYFEIEQALRARMGALGGWPLLAERRLSSIRTGARSS